MFSVEALQVLFDPVMPTIRKENILSEEESRYLWSTTVSQGVERLDREERDEWKAGYSSAKELLLEYREAIVDGCGVENNGQSWTYCSDVMVHC